MWENDTPQRQLPGGATVHVMLDRSEIQSISPRDRFLGCLLGMAIGDALGMPVEGWTAEQIAATHGWIDRYLPRTASNGMIEAEAGEFTDDTELALCQVEGLITTQGFVDPVGVGLRLERLAEGPAGRFLDSTTKLAISKFGDTESYQDGVIAGGRAGNGAISLAIPIALIHSVGRFNPELFTREVIRAALITHAHLESLNAALAAAYGVWLQATESVPPAMLVEEIATFIDEDRVAEKLRFAGTMVGAAPDRERDLANLRQIGTSSDAAETVAASLYCVATYQNDSEGAMLTAANAGGDTDSIAAIVGALTGARVGGSGLPRRLVEGLAGSMYIGVATPGFYRTAQRRAGMLLALQRVDR